MEKRCFNCMEPLKEDVCPQCGYKSEQNKEETVIKDRYFLGNVFSKSLDSTVYIAYDKELNKKVLVRKFTGESLKELSKNRSHAELAQRFLSYAKTTATVSLCDILPRTVDTFAEQDTAYWVTDYFDGKSLKELLNSGVKISSSNALKITNQLLKGIKPIHSSGLVFGAISPETVYILKNGEVRLFGLGSTFYNFTDDIDCRVELLNPSYSAPELFDKTAKIAPYSDVYSIAAILYRIIVGKIPAISFLRSGGENLEAPRKVNKEIPKNIETALLNALNWQTEKRTVSPEGFLTELSAERVKRKLSGAIIWANCLGFFQGIYDKVSSKNASQKDEEKQIPTEKKAKIPLLWLWITIPGVILVGLIVALIILFPPNIGNTENTSSSSTESEDTWYYGSGIETPNNNSNYVYGGNSSKRPNVSTQSRPQNTTSYSDPNAIECPDLLSYSLEQAKKIIAQNNLILGDVAYEYSNYYPVDFVMAQSLKSGRMVQKGSKINLVVCKGPKPLELPTVTGMEMQKATQKLSDAGFINIEYSFVLSDDAPGTVTDATFENEASASYDSKVILTVSGERAEIADYSGKKASEIINSNPDFNFVFKTEDGKDLAMSEVHSSYTVISQDFSAGSVAYKGMTITLTVTQ